MFDNDPEHMPVVKLSKTKKVNPTIYAVFIKALMEDPPKTLYDLERITGLHEWTLRYYVKALVVQKITHISGWLPDKLDRDATPLYKFGFGINVPRRHKTGAQKMRERRAKLRKQAVDLNAQVHAADAPKA